MFKQVGRGPGRAEGREVQVGGLREGKLSPGSPADKRPRQVDWTAWRGNGWGDNGAGPALYSWKETDSILSISPSPLRLVPNLASSAVPRLQPLQAVATCSPHLVRSPAPPLVQDQCAVFLCNWQRYKVLVNVVTKSLVFPQWLLATLPTIKCLHIPNLHLPSVNTQHQGLLYGA